MSDGPNSTTPDTSAAGAASASYHFQQFVMRLEREGCTSLFNDSQVDCSPNEHFATFAHELTHYVQGLSTVLGQRLILNWFALICEMARQLKTCTPLKVPTYRAIGEAPEYEKILKSWNSYMGEVMLTVGASHALRPPSELKGKQAFEFYDYKYKHPFDGSNATCVAVALPDSNGKLVGVPMQGDFFLEGQAQNVQWLVDGTEANIDERLTARSMEPRGPGKRLDVYYTAAARIVRHRFPDWDPSHTTVLLCDVALCAKKPATAFVAALDHLKQVRDAPKSWDEMRVLRSAFDKKPYIVEGRDFMEAEIKGWKKELRSAGAGTVGGFMLSIIGLMEQAWKARSCESLYFSDPSFLGDWVERVVKTVGAPPIFLKDIDNYRSLTSGTNDDAMFWLRGSFDLLNNLVCEGFTSSCPMLRTRICSHKKDENCRTGDLLNSPSKDGKGCHIAFAAQELGIYQRHWQRV